MAPAKKIGYREWRAPKKIRKREGVKGIMGARHTFMNFSSADGKVLRNFFLICCSSAAVWFLGRLFFAGLCL